MLIKFLEVSNNFKKKCHNMNENEAEKVNLLFYFNFF